MTVLLVQVASEFDRNMCDFYLQDVSLYKANIFWINVLAFL